MKCPNCGLYNPDEAQRCDYGYDFQAKTVKRSYLGEGAGPKPPTYRFLALLSTFCFFLPLGIAASIYSVQVDSKYRKGDFNGAIEASNSARNLALAAIGIGLVGWVVGIIVQIAKHSAN